MYLKYISNEQIEQFINSIHSSTINAQAIIMPDSNNREFIDVFTNFLNIQLRINDFECINILSGAIYNKQWRNFMIKELNKQNLGNEYIESLHDYLEQDAIYGPVQ